MQDIEKLGAFYLGRVYDTSARQTSPDAVLYDSKDLVTHAVVVGMTGSGKTGLCIDLLEEAAIDGIPALVIDPKGDIGNLLLQFPNLRPEDFAPWVNQEDAARAGQTVDQFAAAQAELWSKGLDQWGQSGRTYSAIAVVCRFRDLHAGQQRRHPDLVTEIVRSPRTSHRRRSRTAYEIASRAPRLRCYL